MGEIRRRDELEPHEFRRLRKAGWLRVIDGVAADPAIELTGPEQHRRRAHAVVRRLTSGAVVSHQSAAVVYGLPVWDTPLDVVHITRSQATGGRRTRDAVLHAIPIVGLVAVVGGLLVTTPARTIVDCARTLDFEHAVVIGDAAVRKFGVTSKDLERELDLAKHRKGIAAARRAVAFLDGHSESAGESRSRIALARNDIRLVPQGDVFSNDGRFLGRVDFFDKDRPVIGEFDGDLKYDGPDGRDVLRAEKVREDLLRNHSNEMVRWGWQHLTGTGLRAMFDRAYLRGGNRAVRHSWIRQAALPRPVELVLRSDW